MPSEVVNPADDRLEGALGELETILQTLVLNDSTILDALAQMLTAVQQMQGRAEQSQNKLVGELRTWSSEMIEAQRKMLGGRRSSVIKPNEFTTANPEIALLEHLYSYLPDPTAVDVGANVGLVSERLLEAGYEVYAFEPYAPVFERLREELEGDSKFHAFDFAIGVEDTTMNFHVASKVTESNLGDPTLFNSLIEHPMPEEIRFTQLVPVTVRSLESLRRTGDIPDGAGVLKIDTEGFDLQVIRGMGSPSFSVVMTEFWDAAHLFGLSGEGRLQDLVSEMKERGYRWHIVIYHLDEEGKISFYCNRRETIPKSWGNAIFFREHAIFAKALEWCEQVLDQTWNR